MENQSDDRPLKWFERIRYGLFKNKYFVCEDMLSESMINKIFTNIRERTQILKNFVDFDVTFDNKEYLLRLSSSNWKLIPKNSAAHKMVINLSNTFKNCAKVRIGNNRVKCPLFKELRELRVINNKLVKSVRQIREGGLDPAIIKTIINCNNILIKMLAKKEMINWIEKRNQKRQENIEKYKENYSWIPDKEWEKLSLFQKVMKRWNFSDMHQCLVPWEEKKFSKKELHQFQEEKRKWRILRMKELGNDPLQRKIFDEFCHARKIGRKIIRNLDNEYTDSFSDAAEKMKGNNNNPYKN